MLIIYQYILLKLNENLKDIKTINILATFMVKVYKDQVNSKSNLLNIDLINASNIQEFVKNATWKDILLNLVETNKLNVWDVDISKIVDSYLKFIKQLKTIDLYIPSNIILAASILLKLKSKTISFESEYTDQIVQEDIEISKRIIPQVDDIYPRFRLQPNKKITLDELVNALNEAMVIEKKHKQVAENSSIPMNFFIDIGIDEKIDNVYNLISKYIDSQKMTTFNTLKTNFSENLLLNLFVPLLFLMHQNKILIIQETFFGEILIKLNN